MRLYRLLFVLFLLPLFSVAQSGNTRQAKMKPPKLFTQLGGFRDSVQLSVSEAEAILDKSLRIIDDKQQVYTLSSYQFLYQRKVATEEEETGKVSYTTALQSQRFRESPLPPIWISTVREQVKAGEMLLFFDIIVKDAKGRVMYAPDLKIMVK